MCREMNNVYRQHEAPDRKHLYKLKLGTTLTLPGPRTGIDPTCPLRPERTTPIATVAEVINLPSTRSTTHHTSWLSYNLSPSELPDHLRAFHGPCSSHHDGSSINSSSFERHLPQNVSKTAFSGSRHEVQFFRAMLQWCVMVFVRAWPDWRNVGDGRCRKGEEVVIPQGAERAGCGISHMVREVAGGFFDFLEAGQRL